MWVRIVLQHGRFPKNMPPIWPFNKKKQPLALEEEAPTPIVYRKTEDLGVDSGSTSQQQEDYKAALSFFGSGDATVHKASDQSQRYDGVVDSATPAEPVSSPEENSVEWVAHTDGYHYKKAADGSFDPVAHIMNADGSYEPYS